MALNTALIIFLCTFLELSIAVFDCGLSYQVMIKAVFNCELIYKLAVFQIADIQHSE